MSSLPIHAVEPVLLSLISVFETFFLQEELARELIFDDELSLSKSDLTFLFGIGVEINRFLRHSPRLFRFVKFLLDWLIGVSVIFHRIRIFRIIYTPYFLLAITDIEFSCKFCFCIHRCFGH